MSARCFNDFSGIRSSTFVTASLIKWYASSVTPLAKSSPVTSAPNPFLITVRVGLGETSGVRAVSVSIVVLDMVMDG